MARVAFVLLVLALILVACGPTEVPYYSGPSPLGVHAEWFSITPPARSAYTQCWFGVVYDGETKYGAGLVCE